ncbi:RNA polymerase sigma factor [Bacillus velezensis]|uniref:RNA polymerase sigma factor n=1 Tax=Bacillus velezensis TaxID=492670 RepID=UPI003990255E
MSEIFSHFYSAFRQIFQELSYEEIADVLDWSLSKVKSTLYRARMQLKQHLAEKGRTDRSRTVMATR